MTAPDWFDALDGTWPAAEFTRLGPLTLRLGRGGGSRVSATTIAQGWAEDDLDRAESAMREMDQRRIFQLRPGQDELDAALAARGYDVMDPVTIYACPTDQLCDIPVPPVTVLHIWEPLALMRELWFDAGIGPGRLAVMGRVQGPRTGMLGRWNEKPAGVGFAAIHDDVAMVHALEILAHQRRNGMGGWFMRSAAIWARKFGADWMSVMCTDANAPANALYRSLGMQVVGRYHYRIMPEEDHP